VLALLRGRPRAALARLGEVEWRLLVPLVTGIGLAVVVLAGLIETLLRDRPVEMAALFLGLVGGSTVVAWRLLERRDAVRIFTLLAVSVAVFVLLGLREGTSEEAVSQLTDPALWAFFGAGAVAICAMILPGISGSFILVMLSMYGPVLGAVNDRRILTLLVFVAGTVVGLALFSQGLHWALTHHSDTVMAALIGLMLGSIRVLWPWPDGVESTALEAPDGAVVISTILAIGAFLIVVGIDDLARRRVRRRDAAALAKATAS
jgi:putative membrane protein